MVASTIFKVMTLTMLTTLCEVQGLDLTLTPNASGLDVVNSVFDRIRSKCVFSEDRLFLRRTAYVMSLDGNDSFTYRTGFDGGIWQITESMFLATQNCSQSSIRDACGNITSGLDITWSSVQWSDLRKPLYSGLAAALSALHTLGSNQMPGDIPSQAHLWASMYNKTDGDTFVQYATLTPIPQCQDKLDLAFVLDSSSSVSSSDFQLMKNFTASVVDVMNVSLNAVRIADIIYASTVNVTFDFDDYTSKAAVQGGLLSAAKLGTGTNTTAALHQARALYNSSLYGARTDAKRVTVLVTDGMSYSFNATVTAAENLKSANVTVFAVGVGDYNLTELQAVASHPVCSHVLTLTGFDKIDSIIDEIQQSACKANHIGHVENSVAIDITIETPVPPPNKALEATVSCGILHIYVSVTERKPSVAVYDELYIATPERPAVLTIVDSLPEGNRVYVTVIGTPMHQAGTSSNNCTDYRWSLQPTFKNIPVSTTTTATITTPTTSSYVPVSTTTTATITTPTTTSYGNITMRARLVNGTTPREGRLEVSVDGQTWGTVCDDYFSTMNARVVCTMLGYNVTYPQYRSRGFFGIGSSGQSILLDDVQCTGRESNLLNCQHNAIGVHNCVHSEDVGVICGTASGGGQLLARLVNGTSNSNGRLEIQLNGGNWSTVCDDSFGTPDAVVACRMLGFTSSNPVVVRSSVYGAGNGSIILDDLQCTGTELSLSQCGSRGYYSHNCNHYEDVGLQCIPVRVTTTTTATTTSDASGGGQLRARLVSGTSNSNGRLEIQLNGGNWSTVCDDSFGTPDAVVACRMLGFTSSNPVVVSSSVYGAGTGSIILDDLQCTGTELSLSQCGSRGYYSHNCNHNEDVGLQCIPVNGSSEMTARLVGGSSPTEGRLEVSLDGQTWGTVCDDGFSSMNAHVVCTMLGYNATNPQYYSSTRYGAGNYTQPILLDDVACTGRESNLLDCQQHNPIGVHNCGHGEDIGVACDTVNGSSVMRARLVAGTTPREGRLEVSVDGQTWGTVCDDDFSTMNARVVCNMLGYNATNPQYRSSGFFGAGNRTQPILLDNVRCTGSESNLLDCQHNPIGDNNCSHGEDVSVVCGPGA